MAPLRIGILGAARIADKFTDGLRGSKRAEVVAVASRSRNKADAFAAGHGIERAFGSYQELLEADGVDAVYVPLPNSLHADWTIAAARSGKHVLCEKPLALDEAEGRAMFDAARAGGVVLLEAYPFHFQPQTRELLRLLASGAIGELRTLQASFGYTQSTPADVRLKPELGGGALMDVGCYPVSLARLCFRRRPRSATAVARMGPTGVDRSLVGTLEFEGGGLAQISCSFDTAVHRCAVLAGSGGVVETEYQNHTDRSASSCLRLRTGTDWGAPFETLPVARENGFRLEAEAFADLIERRDHPAVELHRAASLDTLAALEALRESARSGGLPVMVKPDRS
jgi:predicted dehydrogenase